MTLPVEVVRDDHDLETRIGKMSERLAKLRWHWTLDESNPGRVSMREYARQVGRSVSTIHGYAHGWQIFSVPASGNTLGEAIERAKMGGETEAVTEAVAEARGVTFKTARHNHYDEVKRVRSMARDAAEKKGTTVEEEAHTIAQWAEKARATSAERAAARSTLSPRYLSTEKYLQGGYRQLRHALEEARDAEFDTDAIELLQETMGNIRALLNLIDMAFAGTTDVDWDRELAALTKEV